MEGGDVELWVKIAYTLMVALIVPVYWAKYGLRHFLWFSDIALLTTVASLWLESRFLNSMMAVGVLLLELGWVVSFLVRLVTGVRLWGLTDYMFDPEKPLYLRGLSLFHIVLVAVLIGLLLRLGYDPHAWLAQSALAWVVLPLTYALTEPERNLNAVFGPGGTPQQKMPPRLYLALVMVFYPVCVYLPTHLVLQALIGT